jgi:signal transduction histidine kinase
MSTVAAFATAAVAVVVGFLVLMRSTQRRIGWLLVTQGVCFGALLSSSGEATSHAGRVGDQLAAGSWVFLFLWLVVIAYLLPDGHPLSPRWRRWMAVGLGGVVMFLVGAAGDADGFRQTHHGADPPLRWLPPPIAGIVGVVGLLLTVGLFFGAAFAVRARLRRSSGDARLQLLWLVWGATSLPLALALAWVGHFALADNPWVVDAALVLAGGALPVTIGIAILRYRLFDIQLVLSRTLTYGVLVAAVVAVYGLLLVVAQGLLGDRTLGGVFAVALVAVLVQPVYSALRQRVERWVYGYRSDPALALRKLGANLETTDPLHVVETITDSIRDALKVDRVWLAAPGELTHEDARTFLVPLVHRGELLGDLVVEVPAGRHLTSADTALLDDLARHASVTVRAAQLAADLQESRSRIVTAREEERKRLRRDLHDGVGPSLAAILLKLEAARSRNDPAARDDLLDEVRDETKEAITGIRRAVDELRPPALDEVGLCAAIRQRAASLTTDELAIEVESPETSPQVPAAVEVAAFRIASEAMTNVSRHSGATRCHVQLVFDRALRLTVSDNGQGTVTSSATTSSTRVGSGVGWTSMTERAAELGGSCTITPRTEGGLTVHAVLPLPDTKDPAATDGALDAGDTGDDVNTADTQDARDAEVLT